MRDLLRFIFQHHFVFLFIVIEIFCLSLVVRYNDLQRAKFIASSDAVAGGLNAAVDGVSQYLSLRKVNKILAQENANLRKQLHKSKFELSIKPELANDSLYGQQYLYIPAKVINNSTNRQKNYITINRGERHGVYKDMAVVSSQGIVGIVNTTSKNFATVITVLHRDFRVSAKIADNNYFGSIYWEGKDATLLHLSDIPYHAEVKKGQKVVTTSFSNVFPTGVTIGIVDTFDVDRHKNFYDIQVSLYTDMRILEYVYVVKDLLKYERAKLEKRIKE